MKRYYFFFAVPLLFLVISCTKKTDEVKSDARPISADSAKVIDKYTCPMHPEVISDKAGQCPKCKMDLVKAGEFKLHDEKYAMTLTTVPATITTGKPVLFKLVAQFTGTKKPLQLSLAHEKIMHLIVVSTDISYFEHIHPIQQQDGSLTTTTILPHAGYYRIFADITPTETGHNQVFDFDVMAEGGTAKPVVPLVITTESTLADGYKATLTSIPMAFQASTTTEVKVVLTKDSKPIKDLGKYMGSLSHMVIISEDGKLYLHAHPEDGTEHEGMKMGSVMPDDDKKPADKSAAGPEVKFHTNFPKAGKYKIFVQVNHQEKIQTFSFGIDVKEKQ
jgi:hypothetical protein